jgi:hypothetical protein
MTWVIAPDHYPVAMHPRRAIVVTELFAAALFAAALILSGCAGSNDIRTEDDDLGTVDAYEIGPDASLSPEPSGPAEEIWTMFVRVVSEPVAADTFTSYRVGDAPDSDTMAYVSRDIDDPAA